MGAAPQQVSIEQLAQFLADPARAFLKSAAGITVYRAAEVSDEIPLEAGGLQRWAIMSDLLGAWKAGLSGDEVETALRHREEHPPLAIGRLAFESARADAWSLWELAGGEWASELEEHRLSLTLDLAELGVLELTGDVRTRGGAAVAVTASTGDEQLIAPWLESLALAACGHASPARLYRLVRVFGDVRPQSLSFTVEDQADATQWLSTVARAYALGQHRLLAVPATPAIQFARETAAGTFAPDRPVASNKSGRAARMARRMVRNRATVVAAHPLSRPVRGTTANGWRRLNAARAAGGAYSCAVTTVTTQPRAVRWRANW